MGTARNVWIKRIILFYVPVVGALAAVADVAINWENLQRANQAGTGSAATESTSDHGEGTVSPSTAQPTVVVSSQGNGTGDNEKPPPPPRRDPPAFPLDFTLSDGEQRTFLGDQASVAAEFNQVGSEDFVTLRVGTTEGESVPHAVLSAGARFPIRVAGSDYSVYVLSVDKSARTVGVRISRNSDSP